MDLQQAAGQLEPGMQTIEEVSDRQQNLNDLRTKQKLFQSKAKSTQEVQQEQDTMKFLKWTSNMSIKSLRRETPDSKPQEEEIDPEEIAKHLFKSPDSPKSEKRSLDRMTFRKNKRKFIIYPEDPVKQMWDIIMTLVLLGACIMTPLEIAFSNDVHTSLLDDPVSFCIDLFFLVDILLIVNTAFYNDEMELI